MRTLLMKCHGCGTPMLLEKSESGATPDSRASIHWHHCPLCGKTRLISQLDSQIDSLADSAGRMNDSSRGAPDQVTQKRNRRLYV